MTASTLAFVLYVWCTIPEMVNNSRLPWTARDKEVMAQNSHSCERVKPQLPCVVKFVKVGELNYRVICGKKRGQK